jgi:hypothetical protein
MIKLVTLMNLIYHAGYVKFNLNRKSKIGGGVCIYIKDNIKAKIRNDITSECNTSNIESIFIELLNPKEKNNNNNNNNGLFEAYLQSSSTSSMLW